MAVLGHNVGSGVVEVIEKHRMISAKAGQDIRVKYTDIRDFDDSPYKDKFIKDFSVTKTIEVTTVVETIGGVRAAYEYTRRALAGKNVVTSNKSCRGKSR